jgi:hypothetical protein
MRRLVSSNRFEAADGGAAEQRVELSSDVALQAAQDLAFGESVRGALWT